MARRITRVSFIMISLSSSVFWPYGRIDYRSLQLMCHAVCIIRI